MKVSAWTYYLEVSERHSAGEVEEIIGYTDTLKGDICARDIFCN